MDRQDKRVFGAQGRELPPLVVILGPTAVGKTALSLELAEAWRGEIVSADSRQIYRGMEIGTAKATPDEQARAPHHLLDLVPPDQTLTVAEYQRLAYAAIDAIHSRGGLPLLVGGTTLYLRAVVEGLRIPEVPPDPELRRRLEAELEEAGSGALFARLQARDPATAAVIDRHNPRRVLRALEIVLITGRSKVELEGAAPPPYRMLRVGLDRPRAALYARTDARVDAMVADGLVEETARLLQAGYSEKLPAMTSLGYREMAAYLRGEMTLAEAVERIKIETHRFVRRQYTGFRKLEAVQWFDLEQPDASQRIRERVGEFIRVSSSADETSSSADDTDVRR